MVCFISTDRDAGRRQTPERCQRVCTSIITIVSAVELEAGMCVYVCQAT